MNQKMVIRNETNAGFCHEQAAAMKMKTDHKFTTGGMMKALKVSVLFLAVCFCFVSCSSQSSKKAQAEQKIADALSKGMLAPAVDQLVKAAQSQGRKVDADQIGKIIEKHSKEGASKTIALLDNGAIDTIASMQTFNFNNFGPILDKLIDQKNKQVIIGLITEMGNNCGREVGQTLETSK